MREFDSIFWFDFKRFFNLKRSLVVLGLVVLIFLTMINGISEYRNSLPRIKHFQDFAASKTAMLRNYTEYSFYGVKFFYAPGKLSSFLKNKNITGNLSGRVDSITALELLIDAKSSAIFLDDLVSPFRWAFIFFILGTLFVIFSGAGLFRDKEVMRFLCSRYGPFKTFTFLFLSRILIITFILGFIFGVVLLVTKITGLDLAGTDIHALTGYFKAVWLMLVFFFSSGVLIGSIRKREHAVNSLLALWIVMIFFVPGGLNAYIAKKAETISSSYQVEFDQLGIVKNFEQKVSNEAGTFSENVRKKYAELAEYYFNNVYPKIEALENKLKEEMVNIIEQKRNLSFWTPTTFFLAAGNAASGYSLDDLMNFYSFLQEMKKKFLHFWIDRVYHNDPKQMVSFVTGNNSNVFHVQSSLPLHFGKGMFINLVYCLILFFFSYDRHKKVLFPTSERPGAEEGLDIHFEKNKKFTIDTYQPDIAAQVVNVFFGIFRSFKGKITLDNADLVTRTKKEFLYLPAPDKLPEDIKTGDFLILFKRMMGLTKKEFQALKSSVNPASWSEPFGKLQTVEKANILLSMIELSKCGIYLLRNFASALRMEESFDLSNRLLKFNMENTLLVNLVTDGNVWLNSGETLRLGVKGARYTGV
jgi:hypothetical protein